MPEEKFLQENVCWMFWLGWVILFHCCEFHRNCSPLQTSANCRGIDGEIFLYDIKWTLLVPGFQTIIFLMVKSATIGIIAAAVRHKRDVELQETFRLLLLFCRERETGDCAAAKYLRQEKSKVNIV